MDLYLTNASVVFSNDDNKSVIELSNEILKKIRTSWNVKLITGKVPFLLGTNGNKMSKNRNNCISFIDDINDVRRKIFKLKSDQLRYDENSPGNVENSIVFNYLKVFLDVEQYDMICQKYIKGLISDLETKEILIEKISHLYKMYNDKFEKIDDKLFLDGMFSDNIPVKLLVDKDYKGKKKGDKIYKMKS